MKEQQQIFSLWVWQFHWRAQIFPHFMSFILWYHDYGNHLYLDRWYSL